MPGHSNKTQHGNDVCSSTASNFLEQTNTQQRMGGALLSVPRPNPAPHWCQSRINHPEQQYPGFVHARSQREKQWCPAGELRWSAFGPRLPEMPRG